MSDYTPKQQEYINSVDGHAHNSAVRIIGELEAELKKHTCLWTREVDPCGEEHYEAGCGNAHEFHDGTPTENRCDYCPYCGKPIHLPREGK